MSPNNIMGTQPGCSSEGKTSSNGLKRKRGGQAIEMAEIIRNAREYANDQLKTIAEWPNVRHQEASATHVKDVRQLQEIP
ncbi:RING-H2 finger protein ATL66 [Cucumis melo var. makuwa]|uniref:RING-H2 finger protein ATL66 n=2 Tax=Cucumis melo TaxID=3656 RepID=A0A5A7T0C2_CUCMM|nr:RING-H2 finger protein ATL66 [Cucumis melo var. makuwa]TYJ95878.1 RING-H2 finger protein ATL66 [Cucumis melo var. makuwa]